MANRVTGAIRSSRADTAEGYSHSEARHAGTGSSTGRCVSAAASAHRRPVSASTVEGPISCARISVPARCRRSMVTAQMPLAHLKAEALRRTYPVPTLWVELTRVTGIRKHRRQLSNKGGPRMSVSMQLRPCFRAVDSTLREVGKSFGARSDRNTPEIFMLSFIMLRSRSAWLFLKGTSGSCRKHHFATQLVRPRHSVCALGTGAAPEQPHARPRRLRDRVLFLEALRLPARFQGELARRLVGQPQEDPCANRLRQAPPRLSAQHRAQRTGGLGCDQRDEARLA